MSQQKKARFKRVLENALEQMRWVREENAASVPFSTLADGILEHATRMDAVDKLVQGLGWRLEGTGLSVRAEARVNASDERDSLYRLTYDRGRRQPHSLIILETKRAGSRSPVDCAKDLVTDTLSEKSKVQ